MGVALKDRIRTTNALACLDCGKCTSVCPVSRFGGQYSPRLMVRESAQNLNGSLLQNYDLWSCLTCKRCLAVCPSNVQYNELTQVLRSGATAQGFQGKCSHSGAVHQFQRLQANETYQPHRLDWLPDDLKVAEEGEILYYVGCTPFYDVLFSELNLDLQQAAINSIRLLNHLGITPVVMAEERCCGHDLYWNGEGETFRRLAALNLGAIKKTGAKTILFSCAECLSAFKELYPREGFHVSTALQHISQFIAQKIEAGDLQLKTVDQTVTYQDPCRLGRHLGIYDEPRRVLSGEDGNHLVEMSQSGKGALCCGVSAWVNCDLTSKHIQTERLRQAHDTAADVLAVACPKCQIHLICTMKDQHVREQYGIPIKDIASLTMERVEGMSSG